MSVYTCADGKKNKINCAFTKNYILFILAKIAFVHSVFVQEIEHEIMKA